VFWGLEAKVTKLSRLLALFLWLPPDLLTTQPCVQPRLDPTEVYGRTVDPMPEPGDLIAAFSPQSGRCFRMVQSQQLQATHCGRELEWKGIWTDRKGRGWYVEACRQHAPKVTSTTADGF